MSSNEATIVPSCRDLAVEARETLEEALEKLTQIVNVPREEPGPEAAPCGNLSMLFGQLTEVRCLARVLENVASELLRRV